MPSGRLTVLAVLVVGLPACSTTPTPRSLAQDAVAAMGGTDKLKAIQTIVMKGGTGTRLRLGQTVRVGAPETAGALNDVVEILDLAGGRASLDYELSNGGFMQHRHEILTKKNGKPVGIEIVPMRPIVATSPGGLFSWGTQNSPEMSLRRNIVTVLLAAAASATDTQAAEDRALNTKTYKYGSAKTVAGEEVGFYFDPQSRLPVAYEVTDTETMLGDVAAQYLLDEYKSVGGVMLPHHITIRKGGKDYSEVRYSAISLNDAPSEAFAIPSEAAAEADDAIASGDYSPLALTKIADRLYFARAYSHNSMVVEFPNWLAVVEAPYTETQTKMLAKVLAARFPNKPIKYAAVTHHHYDHVGGVRAIAATGATVLVERGHEAALRELLETPHVHLPDELERRRRAQPPEAVGAIEVYDRKKVISDGGQSLELYAINGSPHVEPMVLAYVPRARALFQSDLFFPGTGAGGPAAEHLLTSIRSLQLKVDTNVGGHGGVGPFAELVKAATPTKPAR
jgi:glyoxylase-like metal-dependent hydrolase (beta-lactamase superfamily II)